MTKTYKLKELKSLVKDDKLKEKPIVFKKSLTGDSEHPKWKVAHSTPSDFYSVILLEEDSIDGMDLMFATGDSDKSHDDESYPILYIGHWNDGVVKE